MAGRNTARRDRHRRIIAKGEPPCHVCGEPIDYQAHHLDPLSFTIDHITPLALGGEDTLDNLGPAHRKCNRDKSDKPPTWRTGVTFVTERRWSA
ncbi:HNH endonuclease [Mycobacterium phage Taquito]|uniref:HNH endonuclease n=1 Tax=Mycobacterium phage Taquito TaxID=1897500 RepID=A0A1D8EQ93_9CAUD|nr:HNH endonuclease [Mycobacterium phage Taquito]AOT23214.1 HNH endonuclease [Mycobacterium phage Taquito]